MQGVGGGMEDDVLFTGKDEIIEEGSCSVVKLKSTFILLLTNSKTSENSLCGVFSRLLCDSSEIEG